MIEDWPEEYREYIKKEMVRIQPLKDLGWCVIPNFILLKEWLNGKRPIKK